MIFRAHTRLPLAPDWYDVGFRGTVHLEHKKEGFWLDVHRDVGDVIDKEDPRQLVVVSYLLHEPSPTVEAVLNAPLSHEAKVTAKKTGDGLDSFPTEYREFLHRTARRMGELATRALAVALWRTGARSGPPEIKVYPLHLFWTRQLMEGGTSSESSWDQVPSGIVTVGLPDLSFFNLDESIAPHISLLLDEATPQPLGHDLLREAWRIHESNPRAAVVVAVAAIETGLKQFIASQLPQAEWLLRNLPSPPLHKLLRDFLPSVPSKAKGHQTVPALNSSTVRVVTEAVERRNSIVHVGEAEVDEEWLAALFQEARRLLYDLDYHSGYEWAAKVVDKVHPWGQEWYGKITDAQNGVRQDPG